MRVEAIGDRRSGDPSGAGDGCDDDVGGVSVEVLASAVVDQAPRLPVDHID
jgi:hypothetical protein